MERLLSKRQVKEVVGFSFAHIDRLENEKRFPARVRIGFRVFWVESEIQRWISDRITERDWLQ